MPFWRLYLFRNNLEICFRYVNFSLFFFSKSVSHDITSIPDSDSPTCVLVVVIVMRYFQQAANVSSVPLLQQDKEHYEFDEMNGERECECVCAACVCVCVYSFFGVDR